MATTYNYTLKLNFNANGGSGAPGTVSNTVTSDAVSVVVSATIPSTRPTRYGYTFLYWSGNGGSYQPGSSVSYTFSRTATDRTYNINFSAAWMVSNSTWGTVPSSVQLNGSTSYTFNITKAAYAHHHTVKFKLGTQTLTYTNVNTSVSVTFPTTWVEQLPNNTSGSITCSLLSYNSSGTQIGSTATKSITGSVPSSVVPTISIVNERVNDNATVSTWDILLRGYSKIKFTATAAGAGGSTVSAITYSGAGLSVTSTALVATSDTLNVTGSQTWTVTVRDSRGRTASATYTETVYDYSPPSISSATARRCLSDGTINEASGTYVLYNAEYAYSTANGNNALTEIIESKVHSGYSWTTLANSYTSGVDTVVGGSFDADKTYDVRLTITDSLGNSAEFSVFVPSVQGFALGLKNDRARFGGVPVRAGLQIDWDLYLGDRKVLGTLWTGSWSSSYITVNGISNYSLFIVKMSGQGTNIIASLNGTYFRGMGGYAVSSSNELNYYINATLSGDTLTMVDCHSINASGTRIAHTVTEIIGVI